MGAEDDAATTLGSAPPSGDHDHGRGAAQVVEAMEEPVDAGDADVRRSGGLGGRRP